MDTAGRNAFKSGNKELFKLHLRCAATAIEYTAVVEIWNAHLTYFAMYRFVLAHTRAVSQNLASALHRQHFSASQARSLSRCPKMLLRAWDAQKRALSRRLSALWDAATEERSGRTRSRAKVDKVALLPDFGLEVSEWSPFVTSAGGRE